MQESSTEWHDVPRHRRTDHPMLVPAGSCAVLYWGEAPKWAHPRATDSDQAFGNARAMCSIFKSTVAGNWLGSKRQCQQSQDIPLRKGVQYDTRLSETQHAKGSPQHSHHCTTLLTWLCNWFNFYPDSEYLCEITTRKTCPLDNLAKRKWGTCTFFHDQIWDKAEKGGTLFLNLVGRTRHTGVIRVLFQPCLKENLHISTAS